MIGSNLQNYRILAELGSGGQGTVYKALDERLNRTVVIKVLAPELTAREVNLKRFEREAQLASALDHPNICTIYALGESGGQHFIVMQYVEGKNVRELVNGQPLDLKSALSIGYQVADALAAAHSRAIIHRDIKAGNVMVTPTGLAKVLDFGLAKLVDESQAAARGDMHLTEVGVPYGTATYAAPEQATGGKVDHRADIFSTGVLLHEMLTGTWPFRGRTTVEVRYAVLHDTPQRIADARGDSPPPRLQEVLDRAMAKAPEARYQRMAELRDELRELRRQVGDAGASLDIHGSITPVAPRHLGGAGGVGGTFRRWFRSLTGREAHPTSLPPSGGSTRAQSGGRSTSPTSAPQRDLSAAPDAPQHATHTSLGANKSVAILPFRNLSGDAQYNFYEFSLADAVITELARVRSLVVRPSSMIVKYQGKETDPREAGRELSVGAVLSSNFLRAGDRLRVNAQLLDVLGGQILWSDRIDAAAADLITVQDTIAQRIVEGLRVELSPQEKAGVESKSTRSADAYEEYLRGRDAHGKFVYHTLAREDSDEAIERFWRAVELDPDFALAHCALGGAYANRVFKGFGGPEDYRRAEEEFKIALKMDPQLLEARLHMVFIFLARGEKEKARAWVEILLEEAPNDVGVHFVNGTLSRLDGDYDEALKSFSRMLRLNPAERVVVSYNRARVLMYQKRYDDALAELDLGAQTEPNHPLVKTFRAVVLYRRGQVAEGLEILRDVLARHPRMDGIRPLYAICLVRHGDPEAARAELTERVREVAAADHDIAYWLASAYAVLGEREEAFEWLERAVRLGNENRPWFESNPEWEQLRDDPRFRQLMRRIEVAHQNAGRGAIAT